MILLGTDPDEYSKKCIVMHVKDENGRAKVIAAHTGLRSHGDVQHWTSRDGLAAAKPDTLTIVIEFLHAKDSVVRMYSRVFTLNSYKDMVGSVPMMRDDKNEYVQMAIDSLNE
jgi:hypothetical protein